MQTTTFASPIVLSRPEQSQFQQHKYNHRQYPRLLPSRCTRVQPIASAQQQNERRKSAKKSSHISSDEAASAKRTEDVTDKSSAGLFARDFQRMRESFQKLSSNPDAEPSPVRSHFLKNFLARIMRIQTVIEETTEQLHFPFPRIRNTSETLPGSATRRFMRFFSLKLPGNSKEEEWRVLGYFQWQKVDNNNRNAALPPSEARRLQRKQRRNMLDGIAEMGPNAWRIALQTGGKAVDSIIQTSIDGTRRHNQASARMRLRKKTKQSRKEMVASKPRKSIARKARNSGNGNGRRSIAKTAPPSQTLDHSKITPPRDALNAGTGNNTMKKKVTPFAQPKTDTNKKKANYNYTVLNGRNDAVKLAQSLINPTPRKRNGTGRKVQQSTGNEKKAVKLAETVPNATTRNVSRKTNISSNSGESIVFNEVNFAESLINPTSKKETVQEVSGESVASELLAAGGKQLLKSWFARNEKWTLDSYETRLFFVVMGALAAKSLLITITPIVTLVSHAYIISEAQAPRKMPREMLNNYVRRKSKAVFRVDQFVRNYQHQYEQRYNYNFNFMTRQQRLLPMKTMHNINGKITTLSDSEAVETAARQVGPSTPAILNTPVVGEVLQGVDSVAYSVENSWKRMRKIVGVNKNKAWENEQWVLLQSLEWQRRNEKEEQHRRP